MAQALRALFQRVDVRPLTDGLAAIFNAEASDARRTFEVTRIVVRPPSATGALSGAAIMGAKLSLYRISAASGGEAVAAVLRDTASSALPSQVVCAIMPDSVTVSGAALRSLSDSPTLTFAGSNQWTTARVYGGSLFSYQRGSNADILNLGGDTNVERVVLREGEGVALVLDSYGQSRAGQINITVRNESSGATYQYRSRAIGHPYLQGQAMVSLLNGSGSGVVLGVHISQYPNDGESNLPSLRLARIEQVTDGSSVTPTAHDTGTAVPAALQCSAGDMATKLYGFGGGVPIDWNVTHGAQMSVAAQQKGGTFRWGIGARQYPSLAVSPGLQAPSEAERVLFDARAGSGIVLRPGEGLAVLAGRAGTLETSTFAYFDIEATVLHYPPPAGGGVFPAESQVRDGVPYGPTGTEFVGNVGIPGRNNVRTGVTFDSNFSEVGVLDLPAVTDVRNGISYGAFGAEFTGTLVAGGGVSGSPFFRRGR
jgi:hypothetical protein